MGQATDGYRVCDECGSLYLHFCIHCKKSGIEERVYEIMGRYDLNEEELIRILSEHIREGSFPALNLAITMREMKPAAKTEVNLTAGTEIKDAKERLGGLLERLAAERKPAEKNSDE